MISIDFIGFFACRRRAGGGGFWPDSGRVTRNCNTIFGVTSQKTGHGGGNYE
jgi:hypothetical protein